MEGGATVAAALDFAGARRQGGGGGGGGGWWVTRRWMHGQDSAVVLARLEAGKQQSGS
jgi:hypothetical protein